jgi:hypothetical protein
VHPWKTYLPHGFIRSSLSPARCKRGVPRGLALAIGGTLNNASAENPRRVLQKLRLPAGNLIRMNVIASCAIVFSPFKASKATFALKPGEWLRLGRFIGFTPAIVEKYSSHSTYRPVRKT